MEQHSRRSAVRTTPVGNVVPPGAWSLAGITVTMVLAVSGAITRGEDERAWFRPVSAAAACDRCGADANRCGCVPCPPPCPPRQDREVPPPPVEREAPPAEEVTFRETGFYQAPPPTGALLGSTRSFGFSGGGVVLPELRIRLPSFELPSIYRIHQGARMRVAASEAPWISTGFESAHAGGIAGSRGAVTHVEQDRRGGAETTRGAPTEECEQLKQEYQQKIDELNRKLKDCDELKKCIEDCLHQHKLSLNRSYWDNQAPLGDRISNLPVEQPISIPVPDTTPPAPPPDDAMHPPARDVTPAVYTKAFQQATVRSPLRRLPPLEFEPATEVLTPSLAHRTNEPNGRIRFQRPPVDSTRRLPSTANWLR